MTKGLIQHITVEESTRIQGVKEIVTVPDTVNMNTVHNPAALILQIEKNWHKFKVR